MGKEIHLIKRQFVLLILIFSFLFSINNLYGQDTKISVSVQETKIDLTYSSKAERVPSITAITNTTSYSYEFNVTTGFEDQYIGYYSFHEGARINITATWVANSTDDIMDFGFYIGTIGLENPNWGNDELTGWTLATGGGSPEFYDGIVPITSDRYYIRLINFAGNYTSGTITVQEEYEEIEWDFSYRSPINISIVPIGYEESLFNTSVLLSKLPLFNIPTTSSGKSIPIAYNYKVIHANNTFATELNNFVLMNSVNGTGTTSKLNITALEYQRDNLYYQDIFEPQDGRAINASAIDLYLSDHVYDNTADYTIYLFNFSKFDTPDHSIEHWYNLSEVDVDSDVDRHWWRLEWDNPKNFDAAFPYAAYGHAGRHYFIDPYAFQWYLNWTLIWRDVSTSDGLHDFYSQDLDEYQKTHNIYTTDGQEAIFRYLSSWIAEIIPQHLAWDPMWIPSADSIALEVLLFNNVTHLGINNSDLAWTVNEPYIQSVYSNLLPDVALSTNITIVDLDDWPEIESALIDNPFTHSPHPPQDQWKYVDGYAVFSNTSARKSQDFNLSKADTVVTAYMFVLDNTSFASGSIPWAGQEYTGLGGGGHVTMLMEIDRLFYSDRVTHRQGLSSILIHEIGHAVGFPHTFTSSQLAGDFLWDVMGYYPGTGNFSAIRIERYQQYLTEIELLDFKDFLVNIAIENGSIPVVAAFLNQAEDIFEEITQMFSAHDYIGARIKAKELDPIINQLESIVNDSGVPLINEPNDFSYTYGDLNNFITWNATDDNPSNYTVNLSSNFYEFDEWNGSLINVKVDDLSVGSYSFLIIIMDLLGNTVNDTVVVTVISDTSSAPQNLTGTAGEGFVELVWTAPTSDGGTSITEYHIYRSTSSGSGYIQIGINTTTSYNDTTVSNGVTYYYVVRAVNVIGESVASNEVSATPTAPATVPTAPQSLQAIAGDDFVDLSWTIPSADGGSSITEYHIYRSTTSGSGYIGIGTSGLTSFKDTTVSNGVTYYYVVRAVNAIGEGISSNEAIATPIALISSSTSTSTQATTQTTSFSGVFFLFGLTSLSLSMLYIKRRNSGRSFDDRTE